MKKRPNLVLREPVKLYESKEIKEKDTEKSVVENINNRTKNDEIIEIAAEEKLLQPKKSDELGYFKKSSVKEKMSPRVQQIWDYFCKKAKVGDETTKSFNLTRAEVMKEAGIGSTNTYRDALKKFQELGLLEIELRPGVNSGSIFTLTEKGIDEVGKI